MRRFRYVVTILFILICSTLGQVAGSHAHADSVPINAKAAACARTVEQFVPALDAVLTENPRSILGYYSVLAKYLFLKSGVPGLPAPAPDASIDGCHIDEVVQIAKRSKFFYEANGPPRYEHYIVEFRNVDAKVGFAIEKESGNIIGPRARWIAVYP